MTTAAVVRPDMAPKEEAVVATLLTEYPDELPPCCARLLEHAPESFDDLRLANITVAIRELRQAGKPIAPLTVREQLNGRLDDAGGALFLDNLAVQAVGISIAEFEARDLWEAYRSRRLKCLYAEAGAAMEADPTKADSILANVRRSIDSLAKEQPNASRLTIRTADELLAMTFDDSDRILGDRLMATGQSMVIAGAGSIGKSRLLLQLAVATITGRPFLDFETRRPDLRWLILQAENSNRRLQEDLAALQRWTRPDAWSRVNQQLLFHTLETDADGFLTLDNPAAQRRISDAITENKPGVVCFDSLYNFAIGDLNKDEDMGATLLALSRLTKTGDPDRAPVILHHALTGRAGASRATGYDRASFGRNSKVLHSWARAQINIAPGSPDSNELLVLTCGKCSNGKEFAPTAARLNQDTMIYEVAPDFDVSAWESEVSGRRNHPPTITTDQVRELCKGAMTKKELAKAVMDDAGCARSYAYRMLEKAENARLIHYSKATEKYVAKL